jgi:YggT family protein
MGNALTSAIIVILQLYNLLIFARILMSWVQVDRSNQFVRLVYDLTEPLLGPIRNLLPSAGMFDFSPMIAGFLIQILIGVLSSAGR